MCVSVCACARARSSRNSGYEPDSQSSVSHNYTVRILALASWLLATDLSGSCYLFLYTMLAFWPQCKRKLHPHPKNFSCTLVNGFRTQVSLFVFCLLLFFFMNDGSELKFVHFLSCLNLTWNHKHGDRSIFIRQWHLKICRNLSCSRSTHTAHYRIDKTSQLAM